MYTVHSDITLWQFTEENQVRWLFEIRNVLFSIYMNEFYTYPDRYLVTFEILTTVARKVRPTALWNVTPCRPIELTYSLVESVVSDSYTEDGDRWIIRNVGFYQAMRRLSRSHLLLSVFALYVHPNNNRPKSYHFRLSLAVIYNSRFYPVVTCNESLPLFWTAPRVYE